VLEHFEDVFYRLEEEDNNFYNNDNITLELSGTNADYIIFNKIDNCSIANDEEYSANGVYLDRYLVGLKPDSMNDADYESCQAAVWSEPFITIRPKNPDEAPYSEINLYIRKENQAPTPGAGGSASLTAPSSASGGLGTTGYLLSIRSYATHKITNDNSTIEMLYYLLK